MKVWAAETEHRRGTQTTAKKQENLNQIPRLTACECVEALPRLWLASQNLAEMGCGKAMKTMNHHLGKSHGWRKWPMGSQMARVVTECCLLQQA